MIDAAQPAVPPWARPRHPRSTISGLLGASIRDHPDAVAIVTPGRPNLTYAALGRMLDTISDRLAGAGFGRDTRVGVALPDGPELAVALLAVCSVATCAPLNADLDEAALVRLLHSMRIDALIVAKDPVSSVLRAARRAGVPLIALHCSAWGPDGVDLVPERARGSAAVEKPLANDVGFLMHTSGTTGAPKIVPWKQWSVAEAARNRIELSGTDGADRCLVALPLHSSAGIRRMLSALLTGGSIICAGALTADATVDLLESLAPTQYFAPPASHIALLEAFERRTPRPRHCMKALWSGTTELPDAICARLERTFGVPIIVGYGTTESGCVAHAPLPPARAPAGSVGRAVNVELGIMDDAGQFLGHEKAGEIVVRGPEVFDGYENDEDANRAAFRDGWFRTGDIGHIDRDGFVYLLGRQTDIINRGGMKVAPSEVESALARHPKVIEAAAFAIAHPTLGQDLAAAVVLRDAVSESELRRFLRARLASFKIPTRIVNVAQLPRGASGKLARGELAALVTATVGRGNEPPVGREETEIARIFADVLKVPIVSRRDNFFDLGGDSLSAMNALAAVDAVLGVSVRLEVLFDYPTVSEFTAAIAERKCLSGAHSAPAALARIERRR